MKQERNPVIKGLVDQLSFPEVQMLDALEAAYRLLESEASALYEIGADLQAAELDAAAEAIIVRIEEIAEEVLGEGGHDLPREGDDVEEAVVSLEDDLADAFMDWVRFLRGEMPSRGFESKEEFVELLRHIAHYHPAYGHPLPESATDEQLFEAAQDAYDAYMVRRRTLVAK